MQRLQQTFDQLKAQGRKALVPYFTAGDPSPDLTVELMLAMVDAGVDVIELGVPFSDPMADGPVIQRASERALALGVSLNDCLEWVSQFRQTNQTTPVVLMGYANPIERFGQQAFAEAAAKAGVDGVLVVDYPPEESEDFALMLEAKGLAPIFLLAPTSTETRMDQVGRLGAGYLYYVSLKGVTGAGHLDTEDVARKVAVVRQHTSLPIGVGFGISDAQSAKAVSVHADAVVIGSAIIKLMEQQVTEQKPVVPAVSSFLSGIRAAIDQKN
ncbi:MAG: tryptophan synthase subunit alpha [Pseudomonadota bacterium]